MLLAKRVSRIIPSLTLSLTAKAKAMRKQGMDVIGLAAGEPDFDTPEHIKEEVKKALDEGFTKYTPASGITELKEAICEKFAKDNSLNYKPSEIIIGCGAKHCLYNAIQVLCEKGDEIILPAPYWVSYLEQIKLSGARPVVVRTKKEDGFKITPELLLKNITRRTKLLILNTPSNPTGSVYSREELEGIAEVAAKKHIYVISDEIYEKIVYDDIQHVSIASFSPQIKELSIVINGLSKTYSMTGWRIGYASADEKIIKAMSNLQSHSTSNPVSFVQRAAIVALCSSQNWVNEMVAEFKRRRDYMLERLDQIQELSCIPPQGAFYLFPDISKMLGKFFNEKEVKSSLDFSQLLLEEAKVSVVPGSAFGADNHIRLSYATSMEDIARGMDRIQEMVNKIVKYHLG
ncbi:MAG: pyridoxal phosphate-dependent aminotransferase [Candidatus Aerophobetes bacterium]|nr:pyridoxal phosphate-dependent aminotransferase [Candidatus Aerophobetes bacterium]